MAHQAAIGLGLRRPALAENGGISLLPGRLGRVSSPPIMPKIFFR
jgi:hypothetical protein